MLYLPKRAVFIHIPRTGGHSVKAAISETCFKNNIAAVASTVPPELKRFDRIQIHQTAPVLKGHIKEWGDIYRFAIHRTLSDRLDSACNWIQSLKEADTIDPNMSDELRELVEMDNYREWILENWKTHTTQFFTRGVYGEDLGVEIYSFAELNERWHEICDKCQIPRCNLEKLNGGSR